MKYHLEWPTELQAVERKFLLAFLKEGLNTIEGNPTITLEELAAIVDHRLVTDGRALKKAKIMFDTEKIFVNVQILDWIKYLIIEKNGRVPRGSAWED